jgi:hypothetical protein
MDILIQSLNCKNEKMLFEFSVHMMSNEQSSVKANAIIIAGIIGYFWPDPLVVVKS